MDTPQLPEELQEESTAAQPSTDPLAPCSDEQRAPPLSSTQGLAAEDATPPEDELPPDDEIVEEPVAVVTEEVKAPPTPPADYAVPTELTQAKQASTSGGLLWVLGILIMCAGLGLQYLYYFRLQLVENPQLRPIIAAMCDVSGCELPPRRDLGQIELTEHLMQFHPTYEESLLLTATLANSADFAQPYPLLEVIMTDIEQHVVAHRHFPPEQYIRNYREGDNFPANSEVPLMLEVLDPGNSAVGFEFRFY